MKYIIAKTESIFYVMPCSADVQPGEKVTTSDSRIMTALSTAFETDAPLHDMPYIETEDYVTGVVRPVDKPSDMGGCLPSEQEKTPDSPKYSEVKRRAKPGERIKVVDSDENPQNEYQNGSTLLVTKDGSGSYVYYRCADGDTTRVIYDSEYVVLEPIV